MNNNVLVSIVIPAYNAEQYLDEAIQSVLDQDYDPIELIVVDDGSTDRTAEIAQQYGDKITLHRQKNMGQSAAMNNGWKMSRGTILGYLSADDRLMPGCIRKGVAALHAAPAAVVAYPDYELIDEHSHVTGVVRTPDFDEQKLFGTLHCLPGPGALFRRDLYERIGEWSSSLHLMPDLEFFLRSALHGPFVRVPEILAAFRIHSGSTTYRPASFERGEEPFRMVKGFFSQPDLPANIRQWQRQSLANAYLLSGMIHGQSGRIHVAGQRIFRAFLTDFRSAFSKKTVGFLLRIATIQARSMLSRAR